MIRYTKNISLIFLLLLVISCSSSKANKAKLKIDEEQSFMESNFKELPVSEWNFGDKFVCVTKELPLLLESVNKNSLSNDNFSDSIFVYKGIKEVQTWKGIESHITFANNGNDYLYKVNKEISEILNTGFVPLIPELVSKNHINKADSLLRGKVLYVKTSHWKNSSGDDIVGKKYVQVTVQSVKSGNKVFPLSIIFKDTEGKEGMLYTTMYKNQMSSQYTSFDKLFTFTNPRTKYPQIKDDVWKHITESKVALGMTKDECSISLGMPNKVNQLPEYSGLRERWYYTTGTYLEFKDGLLINFRLI